MIYFFDSVGRITRRSDSPLEEASYNALEGERWIQSADTFSDKTHFVYNAEITAFPVPPSLHHTWDWTLLEWVLPSSALANAKASAAAKIDSAAGRARARYITTTPGQDATYTAKYAEAQAYRAAGYPGNLAGYPFIAGESYPNSNRTPQESADRIINVGDL